MPARITYHKGIKRDAGPFPSSTFTRSLTHSLINPSLSSHNRKDTMGYRSVATPCHRCGRHVHARVPLRGREYLRCLRPYQKRSSVKTNLLLYWNSLPAELQNM